MSERSTKLDINSVSTEDLTTLPGIGPQIASRIITARPFTDLQDMGRVEGIGSQMLERLDPLITFSQPIINELGSANRIQSEGELVSEEMESLQNGGTQVDEILESDQDDSSGKTADESAEAAAAMLEKEPGQITEEPPDVDSKSAEETKTPVGNYPTRAVSRGGIWLMVIGSGVLAVILSLALSLGVLMSINGSLRYTRPAELTQLSQRVDGLNTQIDTLQQDIQGIQTRLGNLEALSGRIKAVEQQSNQLKEDVDKASSQIETLTSDVSELSTDVQTLQNQIGIFQTFLNGLRDLLDGLESP